MFSDITYLKNLVSNEEFCYNEPNTMQLTSFNGLSAYIGLLTATARLRLISIHKTD